MVSPTCYVGEPDPHGHADGAPCWVVQLVRAFATSSLDGSASVVFDGPTPSVAEVSTVSQTAFSSALSFSVFPSAVLTTQFDD